MFMLVDSKSPIKTLAEFLALAKTERVLYGSPGVGNGLHLATEIFAKKAGITLQHVPYKGASEVMTALLGGSVQVMFVTPPSVMGLIKDGRVRRARLHRVQAVSADPRRSADEGHAAGLRADRLVGHIPGARQDAGRHRRQTQRRRSARPCGSRRWPTSCSATATFPDDRDPAAAAAFFRKEVTQAAEAVKAAGIEPN